MTRVLWLLILGLGSLLAMVSSAQAQATPYIGFVYPAGGQQGTTVRVRLGGQRIDGARGALVTGPGISARLVRYIRKLSNQEISLLREQLRELKRQAAKKGNGKNKGPDKATRQMMERLQTRILQWVNRPACASLSSIAIVEVTIAPDAEPGRREIRLVTLRGVTNPLAFYVGQVPEVSRKAMKTAAFQVLGKEALAQRKRPPDEVEQHITLPCTVNGQVASGEVNWYRFQARQGQRLVLSTRARDLIPYIADAVPGWFQPVLTLYDAHGRELAYNDDFRFKPDPTIFFEVPEDGEYAFTITDAIYRGREDFVYRTTIGEMPFITSIFPLGRRVGSSQAITMKGWNLEKATLMPPGKGAGPGVYRIAARRDGVVSNSVPFALDTLPEGFDEESNNGQAHAQKVRLPIIINGRIDRPDDWDVFRIAGRAGDRVVAEVHARRLDSPLDSVLKLTDASGKLLALNDDHTDAGSGMNTHHADSYLTARLPADGVYFIHLGDIARHGGEEYAYRLRISPPRPDFELRVVPSSANLRSKKAVALRVYAIRTDGFTGPIRLSLNNPPTGFLPSRGILPATQTVTRIAVRTNLTKMQRPVNLSIVGTAMIGGREVTHVAVPAEDRMQAFLWRHLVTAEDLKALVYDPSYQLPYRRPHAPSTVRAKSKPAVRKVQFTKRQVTRRLKQLKDLFEEWLLTDDFYNRKVAECEASL